MLLKSIKLKNFRQFRDENIEFAVGENDKNVTIIIGENGSGKTTFAQAFFWCFYGETSFTDKNLLNKQLIREMADHTTESVLVELVLIHKEYEYTITREQFYKKGLNDKVSVTASKFDITYKDPSGQTIPIKKTLCDAEISKILPKELSKYFFFDGERIEKMSKDISNGNKAADFAEAVNGLLGLNGMKAAIDHFNPRSKTSVIGSYENSFDSNSSSKMRELNSRIANLIAERDDIEEKLDSLSQEITLAEDRKANAESQLKNYEEARVKQEQREKLEAKVNSANKNISNMYKNICSDFHEQVSIFFSKLMMRNSLQCLEDVDIAGVDIPSIRDTTIKHLLHVRGKCLCGEPLIPGDEHYKKLEELLKYIPPVALSTAVSDFKKEAIRRLGTEKDLYTLTEDNLRLISEQQEQLTIYNSEIQVIDAQLSGTNVSDAVNRLQNEIDICKKTIKDSYDTRETLIGKQAVNKEELNRAESQRGEIALLDNTNKKIAIYKSYAEEIHKELVEEYKQSEAEIRDKLEVTINKIFADIYNGGLSLSINEKYHIKVVVNDYDGTVETSTAQSIAVIFAFITGVIKLARDIHQSEDDEDSMLSAEPYPLVMDAPLSALDKHRIKTVCDTLPSVAEQVIIFIKDTDGDLAEHHLGYRIGSRHKFVKKDIFETYIE